MINEKIYDLLCNIDNKGCDEHNLKFLNKITNLRDSISAFDRKILDYYDDTNSFSFDKSSKFKVKIDGIDIKGIFCNGSSNSLHVAYAGARSAQDIERDSNNENPIFSRWSYYPLYDGCFIGIAEPMFDIYKNLLIGWFYGDRNKCLISPTIILINKICELKGINSKNVIYFSSSAGGYACLLSSIYIKNSLSISLNPQLDISSWEYASKFENITGIDLKAVDKFNRNNIFKKIKDESSSKHVILINIESDVDYLHQLLKSIYQKNTVLRYGLNKIDDKVLVWLYQAKGAPSPHNSWETRNIYIGIEFIANHFKNDEYFDVNYYQKLAIYINEMWYELYNYKYSLYLHKKKIRFSKSLEPILNSNLLISFSNLKIKKSSYIYNNIKLDFIKENSIYTVEINGLKSSKNIEGFTVALYDFELNICLNFLNLKVLEYDKYYVNFITGDCTTGIKMLIYSGYSGNANDIEVLINNINVYQQNI